MSQNIYEAAAQALTAHEMVRLIGHPPRPDGYTCACGHETRPASREARLDHRARAVVGAVAPLIAEAIAEEAERWVCEPTPTCASTCRSCIERGVLLRFARYARAWRAS